MTFRNIFNIENLLIIGYNLIKGWWINEKNRNKRAIQYRLFRKAYEYPYPAMGQKQRI